MRVQPHLPSSPLLATVMSRSGFTLSACSAANSPAPPEPRIKMSVLSCSRLIRSSEHAREEYESDDGRHRGRERGELFLTVMPVEILDHKDAQPAQQMHRDQKH